MNRRDLLKALGALPIASAWAGCRSDETGAPPAAASNVQVHTLQILLEGAFAVVLQRKSRRLIAFVPRPDPADPNLAHEFYFNDPDPKHPQSLGTNQKPISYEFQLQQDGLRSLTTPKPYINPDFKDFRAETEVWNHPPSLVSLDLPFPGSIHFSGTPLLVRFASKALKPTGMMPTNYIIEYHVDDAAKVGMMCQQMGGRSLPSPNCPPGIIRYYFGVGPKQTDSASRLKHAPAFFNFMLAKCFPQLKDKYALADQYYQAPVYTRPGAFHPGVVDDADPAPVLRSAVLQANTQRPRLQRVASLVDCEIGGILVETDVAASVGK
jgi:hypothetical protein